MINNHQTFNESKSYRIPKKNLDLNFGMDGNVLVIENPTSELFNALYNVAKELRGLATLDNIYFWKADEATHDSMRDSLLKEQGIAIDKPYCGLYYKDNTLFVDGYQYLNGNYLADPTEQYAKQILLNNNYAMRLFTVAEIKNAKNHHIYG